MTEQHDFRFPGCSHGLGNVLVHWLSTDPAVQFVGHRVDERTDELVVKIEAADPAACLARARAKGVHELESLRQSIMLQTERA